MFFCRSSALTRLKRQTMRSPSSRISILRKPLCRKFVLFGLRHSRHSTVNPVKKKKNPRLISCRSFELHSHSYTHILRHLTLGIWCLLGFNCILLTKRKTEAKGKTAPQIHLSAVSLCCFSGTRRDWSLSRHARSKKYGHTLDR